MTDLFQQLGGALNDFKMKNIDSDSLHEIIGEFAPLIGVATDSVHSKTARSEVTASKCEGTPTQTVKAENELTSVPKTSSTPSNSQTELKDSYVRTSTSSALDLSVNSSIGSKNENLKRPLTATKAPSLKYQDNSMIDQTVYKKSRHSLGIPVKVKLEQKILSKCVKDVSQENCETQTENCEDIVEDSKSNKGLYEVKTVYNLKYYQCKLCPKVYDTKYLLNRHLITHGSNRPFACEQCGKAFSQKCDLNRHMSVHNGARQHSCSVCGKSFKRSDYLAKHERQYCGVQKPHKCQKCHKGFEDHDQLLDHTCSGKSDGSFDCEQCSESFSSVDALVEHRKCHLKTEQEYKCTRCNEKFPEFMAYVEHFKVAAIGFSFFLKLRQENHFQQ